MGGRSGGPLADFLVPDGFAGPRGVVSLAREASMVSEFVRLRRRVSADRQVRSRLSYATRYRPEGEPVLLVPGFMSGDYSLAGLHQHLRRQGHRTFRSGITLNVGCLDDSSARLEQRVETIAERRGRKVTLVGHSLGGMLSRGLAARRPDLVAGLVTMGSPILAPGAAHGVLLTQVAMLRRLQRLGLSRLMSAECTTGDCATRMFAQTRQPMPGVTSGSGLASAMPFTVIYSRRDGIVDWRACMDPAALAREVSTSHIGMAFDPAVFDLVAETVELVSSRPDAAMVPFGETSAQVC